MPKPHSHPNEQIAYIMSGRIRFHIGDEVREVGPGGVVLIPSNVRHWGGVIGDEPVMNLDVFAPKKRTANRGAAEQLVSGTRLSHA